MEEPPLIAWFVAFAYLYRPRIGFAEKRTAAVAEDPQRHESNFLLTVKEAKREWS
jgi:hypothetical protein